MNIYAKNITQNELLPDENIIWQGSPRIYKSLFRVYEKRKPTQIKSC